MENYNDLVEFYAQKKLNGADYTYIRNELKQKNIDDHTIHKIISDIDDIVVNEELNKTVLSKRNTIYYTGVVVASLGLIITYGSYSGWFGNQSSYLITYGPFLAGILLMMYARRMKPRKKSHKSITFRSGRINH